MKTLSAAVAGASIPVTERPMPLARMIRAYALAARSELLRALRLPAFLIPFLLLPVLIYVLFGVLMSASEVRTHPGLPNVLFVGYAVFALMGPAVFGMGCSLAMERSIGLMQLKRAMPVPPGAYLGAKLLMCVAFATMATALIGAVAAVAGHLTLTPLHLLALSAVLVAGTLPFCAMGLLIGAYVSGSAAPGFANLVYLPMLYLSGLLFPLPKVLERWEGLWPSFHLGQVARYAAGLPQLTHGNVALSGTYLIILTAVLTLLAMRRLARAG